MKKNKKIFYYLFLTFVTLNISINAQTITVSGNINQNTTWSADTVKIIGNIFIDLAASLTINPGTYVESQGYYGIYGNIIAVGTKSDSIIFTVKDTTGLSDKNNNSGGWQGLRVGGNSRIEFCRIQYGKNIDGDGGGINCSSGGTVIKNNLFMFNSAYHGGGICCHSSDNKNFSDNIFKYNHSYG